MLLYDHCKIVPANSMFYHYFLILHFTLLFPEFSVILQYCPLIPYSFYSLLKCILYPSPFISLQHLISKINPKSSSIFYFLIQSIVLFSVRRRTEQRNGAQTSPLCLSPSLITSTVMDEVHRGQTHSKMQCPQGKVEFWKHANILIPASEYQ